MTNDTLTGSEHYRVAEVLLANLRDEMAGSPGTPLRTREQQTQMIAEAQAHATLALAAAMSLLDRLEAAEEQRDTQYRCAQDLAARLTATQEGEPDYPYPIDALARLHDEDRWREVVPQRVRASDLTPTQPAVTFDRLRHLLNGGEPETGDPHAHVVSHVGALYVHDGHHRYVVALARGGVLSARVVDAKGQRVEVAAQEGEGA